MGGVGGRAALPAGCGAARRRRREETPQPGVRAPRAPGPLWAAGAGPLGPQSLGAGGGGTGEREGGAGCRRAAGDGFSADFPPSEETRAPPGLGASTPWRPRRRARPGAERAAAPHPESGSPDLGAPAAGGRSPASTPGPVAHPGRLGTRHPQDLLSTSG